MDLGRYLGIKLQRAWLRRLVVENESNGQKPRCVQRCDLVLRVAPDWNESTYFLCDGYHGHSIAEVYPVGSSLIVFHNTTLVGLGLRQARRW